MKSQLLFPLSSPNSYFYVFCDKKYLRRKPSKRFSLLHHLYFIFHFILFSQSHALISCCLQRLCFLSLAIPDMHIYHFFNVYFSPKTLRYCNRFEPLQNQSICFKPSPSLIPPKTTYTMAQRRPALLFFNYTSLSTRY